MAIHNNPNIIIRLVARSALACQSWADPHNEAFYLPARFEESKEKPREVAANADDTHRAATPRSEGVKVSEPALQITFRNKPKNPELGYILGSHRESCDVFLGTLEEYISRNMFTINFNEQNEVTMKSSSGNITTVEYGGQIAERRNFTWLFPQGDGEEKKEIFVTTTGMKFTVEVPTHKTDKMVYEANCQKFMEQAKNAILTMNVLDLSSREETRLASKAATSQATAEPPFYLETTELGEGGFGKVYKARSMPGGRTVALKKFKTKDAWTLEADVLRRLAETPHENIVEFIDFGAGNEPYLVMGLAVKGTLEDQHNLNPFTVREVGLILRQMLAALVYLHVDFDITHRDIKPANILCDSRKHCRLADFGLAKEGDVLKTFNGTMPYMAPEMFERTPYTKKVDIWALGRVIAWLLSSKKPPGYRGDEGRRWCEAVVVQFRKYKEHCKAIRRNSEEQWGLNLVVEHFMLQMDPEDRESAPRCLELGVHLWRVLDQGDDGAKTPTQESPSDNDSEEDTEIPEELTPDEWEELEQEHLYDQANVGPIEGYTLNSADSLMQESEIDQEIDAGNGSSGPQHFVDSPLVKQQTLFWHKLYKESSHPAFGAAPIGVRKSVHKRDKSSLAKSVKAAAARQAAEDQS